MLKPSNAFIESVDKGDGSTRTIFCDEFENGKEIFLSSRKITECSLGGHFRLPSDRQSAAEFSHHLPMGDALRPRCPLSLSNAKFLKEVDPSLEPFIMVDGHNNQIAFTVCGEVYRLIFFVADRCDLTCTVSQTGNRLDDGHCRSYWLRTN